MDKNQFKAIANLSSMIIQADKFHLAVAKRLLDPKPLSAQERAALLDQIATRERNHEQIEAGIAAMAKILTE